MIEDNLEKFQKKFKEEMQEFDSGLKESRILGRDVIHKIVILCSTIIGFSITLISLPQFETNLNIFSLRISWQLFLVTIVIGFLSLFIESRIHYVLKWRAIQIQDFDEKYNYRLIDRIKVLATCLYTLFSPRNLIFCKIYKTQAEQKSNALLNGKVIQSLAEMEKLPLFLENLFILFFVVSLTIFVKSY